MLYTRKSVLKAHKPTWCDSLGLMIVFTLQSEKCDCIESTEVVVWLVDTIGGPILDVYGTYMGYACVGAPLGLQLTCISCLMTSTSSNVFMPLMSSRRCASAGSVRYPPLFVREPTPRIPRSTALL